jgi:hypothetical protein
MNELNVDNKTKSTYTFHAEFKDEQRIEFKRLTYTQAKTLHALFRDKFDMVGVCSYQNMGGN